MGQDEEGTIRVLSAHRAVIDGIITFHQGRIVSTAGDSVLAEFSSAVEAVRCAVEIQEALKTRNDSLEEHRQMHFRVGVNLGDVVVKNEDLLGDGVNVAARLETIAEPGGICISSSVYDQITGKLDLGFQDIGEQNLKNISRPIRVYRVSGASAPVRAGAGRPPGSPRAASAQPAAVGDRSRHCGGDRGGGGVAGRLVALRLLRRCEPDDRGRARRIAAIRTGGGKKRPPGLPSSTPMPRARKRSPTRSACAPTPRPSSGKPRRNSRVPALMRKRARPRGRKPKPTRRRRACARKPKPMPRESAQMPNRPRPAPGADADAAARATAAQAPKPAPAQQDSTAKAQAAPVASATLAPDKSAPASAGALAASTASGTSPSHVRSTPMALSVTRCASWPRSRTGFCAETTGPRAPLPGCASKGPFNPTATRHSRRRRSPATRNINVGNLRQGVPRQLHSSGQIRRLAWNRSSHATPGVRFHVRQAVTSARRAIGAVLNRAAPRSSRPARSWPHSS